MRNGSMGSHSVSSQHRVMHAQQKTGATSTNTSVWQQSAAFFLSRYGLFVKGTFPDPVKDTPSQQGQHSAARHKLLGAQGEAIDPEGVSQVVLQVLNGPLSTHQKRHFVKIGMGS